MGKHVSDGNALANVATNCTERRPPTVVIAGCGGAQTVTALCEHGIDAYGFDRSPSILATVPAPTRNRLLEGDIRDQQLIETLCERFELERIDLFVTECMLSFLSVEEAATSLERIRNEPRVGQLLHRVQLDPPVAAQEGDLEVTILTPEAWQQACDLEERDLWREAFDPL